MTSFCPLKIIIREKFKVFTICRSKVTNITGKVLKLLKSGFDLRTLVKERWLHMEVKQLHFQKSVVEWSKIFKIYSFNVCRWLGYGIPLLVEQQLLWIELESFYSSHVHCTHHSRFFWNAILSWKCYPNMCLIHIELDYICTMHIWEYSNNFNFEYIMCIRFLDFPKGKLSEDI